MAIHRWILLRPDGSIAAQVKLADERTPSETGDNPDALREVRVSRHGDLTHESYDRSSGRWVSDKAKKARHERRERLRAMARDELFDVIAAEIEARLRPEIEALAARVAVLEGKGA